MAAGDVAAHLKEHELTLALIVGEPVLARHRQRRDERDGKRDTGYDIWP
jgi:hypothetical protein